MTDKKTQGKKNRVAGINICLTCGKTCKAKYCNIKCYSKSKKLKEQASKSKLIINNKNNKYAIGHKAKSNSGSFKKGIIPWNKGKKLKYLSGKNSSSWKGGLTPLNKQIRNSIEYTQWRSDIFMKDNWTCQTCQKRSKAGERIILESHHKKELSKIIRENNIKTFEEALKCKEIWDRNNGVTLCFDCHKLTKGWNGRKK